MHINEDNHHPHLMITDLAMHFDELGDLDPKLTTDLKKKTSLLFFIII